MMFMKQQNKQITKDISNIDEEGMSLNKSKLPKMSNGIQLVDGLLKEPSVG